MSWWCKKQGGFSFAAFSGERKPLRPVNQENTPSYPEVAESEMIARINHHDHDEAHATPLNRKDEIRKLLTPWIRWKELCATRTAVRCCCKTTDSDINNNSVQNDIDKFVLRDYNSIISILKPSNALHFRAALDVTEFTCN
ncbi:MAG: hypothetical protein IPO37_07210 [Saprospiraceae bacterium]|nr:hypothetical protein [Saprospiraceae bacterium]